MLNFSIGILQSFEEWTTQLNPSKSQEIKFNSHLKKRRQDFSVEKISKPLRKWTFGVLFPLLLKVKVLWINIFPYFNFTQYSYCKHIILLKIWERKLKDPISYAKRPQRIIVVISKLNIYNNSLDWRRFIFKSYFELLLFSLLFWKILLWSIRSTNFLSLKFWSWWGDLYITDLSFSKILLLKALRSLKNIFYQIFLSENFFVRQNIFINKSF